MARTARRQIPAIVRDLINNSYRYPAHQALRLLEEAWFGIDNIASEQSNVYMHPAAEVSFPGADIKRSEIDKRGLVNLEMTFMGLYGVDSPLPPYIAKQALRDDEGAECLRDFLNILNRRLYILYYQVWKKYHVYVQLDSAVNPYMNYLKQLSAATLDDTDGREFAYCGLFGTRQRNAASLEAMLNDYLPNIPVRIRSFQPQQFRIENQLYLGGSIRFDNHPVLGERVTSVTNKIAIDLGWMPQTTLMAYYPGKKAGNALSHLVGRYVQDSLAVDFIFHIKPAPADMQRLGDANLCLGWQTWVGKGSHYCITLNRQRLDKARLATLKEKQQ